MKILFLAPYAPGHVRTRSFHLVRQLLLRSHEVTLVVPRLAADRQERLVELAAGGARIVAAPFHRPRAWGNSLAALLRRRPMQAWHAWSPTLAQLLHRELCEGSFDVLHVEHLRATGYALRLERTALEAATIRVWDSVDCISSLLARARTCSRSIPWRLLAALELTPTRRLESRLLDSFDRVLVASRRDLEALAATARTPARNDVHGGAPSHDHGGAPSHDHRGSPAAPPPRGLPGAALATASRLKVVANGVDTASFAYHDPLHRQPEVVFAGALGYHANATAAIDLVDRIMPRLWETRPETRLVVVGPSPAPSLRRHAAREPRRVRLTGWVPDVAPYLHAAAVSVAPMRYGAGVQNKILEAMACGCAVVSDPRSAAAIGAESGRELLVARDDDEYAAAILELLADPARRARLAAAARHLVEVSFTWERAGESLERLYLEALPRRRSPAGG